MIAGFPLEIVTGLLSAVLGGIIGLWSKRMDIAQARWERKQQYNDQAHRSVQAARSHHGWHFARRTIALTVIFAVFLWPMLVPVFWP